MTSWHSRNSWKVALIFVLLVATGVTYYSASLIPRYDRWQYPVWYLSDYLLTSGQLPTCGEVSSDVYHAWTGKICVRIGSPGQPISIATFTLLTGIDFTGSFGRLFVFTPLLKLSAGYLLVAEFVKSRTSKVLGTGIVYLSPDYATVFFTTAKGFSFGLLLFIAYLLIKTLRVNSKYRTFREHFKWVILYLISASLLLEYYVPRSVIALVLGAGVSVLIAYRRKYVQSLLLGYGMLLVFYFTQRNDIGVYYGFISEGMTALLSSATTENQAVPFLQTETGGIGWLLLTPLAVLGAVGGLLSLKERGSRFLSDERMLWLYSIAVCYTPVALIQPFFRTRLFFEAAIPGLLVASDRCDRESVGRYMKFGVVISLLLVGSGYYLALSSATAYGPQYDAMDDVLDNVGVPDEAIVFTDMRTGAYLVGENRHLNTAMITDGTDGNAIGDVWYYSDAQAACNVMARAGSDYFVLREDVRTDGVPVMNYDRIPTPESAINKYRDSSRFDRVADAWEFDVYRLNTC